MDALIVIFLSGLISLFIAFAKKPVLVLLTSTVGLLIAIALFIAQWNNPVTLFSYEGLEFTNTALLYSIAASIFALFSILIGYNSYKKQPEHTGEYIGLLMFSLVGAVCMLAFTDMFMFFLGLEILSLPIYVLAGTNKKDLRSSEASLKYFLMGAFATGVLLFGIAWTYGATGTFKIQEIGDFIYNNQNTGIAHSSILYVGVLLIMASFLFKVGAAPFHFWSPDVYEGSPNEVTGFMAAVVKLGAFGAFMKIFGIAFPDLHAFWAPALVIVALITIFLGNLSALNQIHFKRLLAYSSITHVGYALLAVLTLSSNSIENLWIYLFGYGFSIIALVAIAKLLNDDEDKISAFKGLAKRNPFLATVAVLALLSLAGVPPLIGFFGKYLVFADAFTQYPLIVIIALANSGIGIYYYLKTVINIFQKEEIEESKIEVPAIHIVVLSICAIAILVGGLVLSQYKLL
ncbi:MAG: NADH-quinone oxidoreductase subunit N [Flavobacteriia bacterium]|nr:NADH-quinone oxidoreductase subunit N [Flavobacteriia bacterium]